MYSKGSHYSIKPFHMNHYCILRSVSLFMTCVQKYKAMHWLFKSIGIWDTDAKWPFPNIPVWIFYSLFPMPCCIFALSYPTAYFPPLRTLCWVHFFQSAVNLFCRWLPTSHCSILWRRRPWSTYQMPYWSVVPPQTSSLV